MRGIFHERALVGRYIDVEVALARAEATCGVIPESAAREIAARARLDAIDFDALRRETANVGFPVLPLVHQLAKICGESGRYVHWGATTQDVMDTAVVLQVRDALGIVESELSTLRQTLARLARQYRDTPMAGRTHLQHAVPITFGYKAAVWLSMFDRHTDRLEQLKPRALVGQFGGAAGTLASLAPKGLQVQEALLTELGLGTPVVTWHVARDGLAEAVSFLAILTGSLGKVAYDVMLMSATELGEISEPHAEGRGASSTMPQKRNPIASEMILAASKAVRQHAGLMLDAMVQDFERGTGPWQAEWIALPDSFLLTSGALRQAATMLGGLTVDAAKMRANLKLSNGLIVSEAVMMALAPQLGRERAHELVSAACRRVHESGGTLASVLQSMPEVSSRLDSDTIARLTDPANYLGLAGEMVDRVLASRARD
jgi:3-carboxy-cis,cis-muconate cycloisomerase